jgi:hypothetical protein
MKRSRINPISKKRRQRSGKPGKLGIVRLYGQDLEFLRRECYDRDEGRCQWVEDGLKCNKLLPFHGPVFLRAHMAHIRNRRNYGDTIDNVRILCPHHHLVGEHNPKSVPKKVRDGDSETAV